MRHKAWWALLTAALTASAATGQEAAKKSFDPIFTGGGIKVYVKMDFDAGTNPFAQEASGAVALEERGDYVASGRSLHVKRAKAGGYFGARTEQIAIQGSRELNIAFCVRAKGMQSVSLNFFDAVKNDNTTPASAARTFDENWRTVVYAVEDFHHNDNPPQRKVPANTRHTNLFFHGQESAGKSGEYWIDKFIIYRGVDTQAPEAPGDLKAKAGQGGQVTLTWSEAKDNAFAAVYSVFRKGADGKWLKVGESIPCTYTDTAPAAGKYAYRVTAADYDNNCSKPSKDATVTASAPPPATPSPPRPQVTDRIAYADNVRKIHAAGAGKVRHDVVLFQGDSITAADVYGFTLSAWLGRGINFSRGTGMMRTDFGKNTIAKDLANGKPEFGVIMWGTNNAKGEAAVKTGMEDLSALIDTCAAFGTVPIVATIPPRGFDKDKQDGETRYNKALVDLCRAKKVPVSYCFEEMMRRDLKAMLGDGVHLVPGTGNDAAGEALTKTIQQVYFALRDTSGSWK